MKVFAYLRVSSKGQLDGNGLDRQHDTVNSFCKSKGYELAEIYQEAVSGTTEETDRPAFSAMVTDILRNGVKTVVVESLDRLAREYRIQEQLIIYLASKDIQLISANTGENVTEAIQADPMKKALVQIQGIFAELDKSLLVKKLRKARESKRAANGKCEGRKSYQEEKPELVSRIKELHRKPKGKPRKSYQEIADVLNQENFKTFSGKPFNRQTIGMIIKSLAR